MPLSDEERRILVQAGLTGDLTARRRAVAVCLAKHAADQDEARSLLAKSFVAATQPSFHLIPRGDAMVDTAGFEAAYAVLAHHTQGFTQVSEDTLIAALQADPATLIPLRMIAGLTHNELAVTMGLVDPTSTTSGQTLRKLERGELSSRYVREPLLHAVSTTILAVMHREVLTVPKALQHVFHSKLDRRDTRLGWGGVAEDAAHGVPYSALLYQRYVGGAWRQAQDAYSEVKGDNVLELPLSRLLDDEEIPYYRAPAGATGARHTVARFGIEPGPDFVLPPDSPTVVIEVKVAEDGGTVRDKTARIKDLVQAARAKGLIVCAVLDGKGWRERPHALVDVVTATEGRVYTLNTLPFLLQVPEIASLSHTARG